MDEYLLTEFSIFYKRLLQVELNLKFHIINKYISAYNINSYNIVYRYIKTIQANRNNKDNTFNKIHKSTLSNTDKLILAVNKMYLSEILNLFANPVFLKNKKVKNNFFEEEVHTNSTEFQRYCKMLKDFRNCIAHCNIKKYSLERSKFIKSLIYFERILKCNVVMDCRIIEKINSSRKLSTNEILSLIYSFNKDFYSDDKIMIALFDDIALINGYTFKNLPQRKTIIRKYYKMLEQLQDGQIITAPDFKNIQIPLFDTKKF